MTDDCQNSSKLPCLDGVRVLVLFGGSELFGQERANLEVFRSLRELGLRTRFITSRKWGQASIEPELDRLGFEWTTAPFGGHWGKNLAGRFFLNLFLNLYGVIATSWRVLLEARRWKPTHIYCGNSFHFSFAIPAMWLLRLPFVFRAGDEWPRHSALHRWIGRVLFARVAFIVCNCEFLRVKLLAGGFNPEKARTIYNYPPESGVAEVLDDLPPAEGTVVFYAGQISEQKGVGFLVAAASSLLREGTNLTVWIAGESIWMKDYARRVRQTVADSGYGRRIHVLGYRMDVGGLMRRADIHVCPSIWDEPSPNVVFEAKREGVPSVVFPRGGIPELIEHKSNGFVCRNCTMEALVEGIRYYFDNPEARKSNGKSARRSLEEKFGLERFQRQWAEVFLVTTAQR